MTSDVSAPGRIMQIAIPVRDLAVSITFYRDVLRLQFLFEAPPALAFFDCHGVRLMLSAAETEVANGAALFFETSGIEQMHRRLVEQDVEFLEAPHMIAKLADREVFIAPFRDPSGNLLALMEERPI